VSPYDLVPLVQQELSQIRAVLSSDAGDQRFGHAPSIAADAGAGKPARGDGRLPSPPERPPN
jgi:hypothetical protein